MTVDCCQQWSLNSCVCGIFRVLEADSRSLHSLSSQHRRLSPSAGDQAATGSGGLSRGDSLSSIVSGTSLGSVASTSQGDDCKLLFNPDGTLIVAV